MKANIKSWTKIFVKTLIVFLIFYMIVVSVITTFHTRKVKEGTTNTMSTAALQLQDYIRNITENYDTYENYSYSAIANINNFMTSFTQTTTLNHIYSTALFLDENKNVITRSGNFLYIQIENSQYNEYSISLNQYMSPDQLETLYTDVYSQKDPKISGWLDYRGDITGYFVGQLTIPTSITVYPKFDTSKRIQFDFDVSVPLNAVKFEVKDVYFSFHTEQLMNGNIRDLKLNPTDKKRTDYTEKLALSHFDKAGETKARIVAGPSNVSANQFQIVREMHINDKLYYLAIGEQSFPLEIAIFELKSTYILILIVMIIFALILATILYKGEANERKLDKSRRVLTNAIALELKMPLEIIRSFSEGLKSHDFDVIMRETDRMDKMVLEMLELSNLQTYGYKLKPENISMKDLTQEEIDRFAKKIEDKQLTLNLIAEGDTDITADRTGMERIVTNFISNAISQTPKKMLIHISMKKSDDGEFTFSITNQGEHITDDQKAKIWSGNLKNDADPGLSIAKNYLDLHHAQYGCENTEDGVEFWFRIGPA